METPKQGTSNPSGGTELRRRLTTPAVTTTSCQSTSRPITSATTTTSSSALGASFIQDKNNEASPSRQRQGPNVSRMIQNTSVAGRCKTFFLFE